LSKVTILNLRPTQFALGMREVEAKTSKLVKLGPDERHDYLRDHPVPLVLGPEGVPYLIDHHHLARAAWEVGIKELATETRADLSHLSESKFWEQMAHEGWVYLHDQFGKGPHLPDLLPLDVRGLADDPFRSLAWAVREEKGYDKSPIPFCEFRWAEFLRKHIVDHPMKMGFELALKKALLLCHKSEAKSLPGYIGE
jgi:hypothetical protein